MTDITPQKPIKNNKYINVFMMIFIHRMKNLFHAKKKTETYTETEYRQKIINAEWTQIFTLTDQIKKLVRSRPENFNLMIKPLQQQRRTHINKLYRIDHWEGYDANMFVFEKNNTV